MEVFPDTSNTSGCRGSGTIEIENNYDIDIDTGLNDLIDDLNTKSNNIELNYNNNFNASEIEEFTATTTGTIFEIIDNNNLEILYIVPMVLGILGLIL